MSPKSILLLLALIAMTFAAPSSYSNSQYPYNNRNSASFESSEYYGNGRNYNQNGYNTLPYGYNGANADYNRGSAGYNGLNGGYNTGYNQNYPGSAGYNNNYPSGLNNNRYQGGFSG